ncbi:MAG: hypothetical protein QOD14_1077 [Solirubrobacterales bacterium]|nr:hypothetical protein [Solirubrobacterales bacterium]
MSGVTTTRRNVPGGRRSTLVLSLLLLAALVALAPGAGSAGAGTPLKTGKYSGHTTQAAVSSSFRTIQFTVKKGKVTLTTEPTVARGYCLSTPVFTLGGTTSSKKLGRKRSFTLTHTFLGNKIDKIHGAFVSSNEVSGYAIYHFQGQDLCSEGKSKVNFTASHK